MVGLMCLMTSCVKYYDLVKSEFPQGTSRPDKRDEAAQYRRSAVVYNQFETQAIFDALWLSDQLRTAYVDLYADKRGLDRDAKQQMLKRQLEENKHWILFYVLADVRDKVYAALHEQNAAWTLSVKIDNYKTLVPDSIKEVDLEPEYQLLFGKTFSLFKTAYLITFPLTPELAQKIARQEVNMVGLHIRSPYKECVLQWHKQEILKTRNVQADEDFYWS